MLTGVELILWIEQFGRWNVQEFVAKRQDMGDVLTYLKAERSLELAKVMPFHNNCFGGEGETVPNPPSTIK